MASRPFVFISSPKDVADYRDTVKSVHAELQLASGGLEFDLYRWEDAFELTPPTDERPPQEFINDRVLAPECRAVIGILGESLGHDSKPDSAILERLSSAVAAPKKPGVLYPWPDAGSRDASDALDAGHFPLTGTSAEILLALSIKKTLKVFFIGSRKVLDAAVRLEDVNFGGDALLAQHQRQATKDKASQRDFASWLVDIYYPGLAAVRNFLRYLNNRAGWYPNDDSVRLGTDSFAGAIRRLYKKTLGVPAPRHRRNVFKGLDLYDVDDKDVFFGRSAWVEARLHEFRELCGDVTRPSLMAITGTSGSGKSSAMRAGLAAHLRDEDAYQPVVLMPEDLTTGEPASAIASIVNRIFDAMTERFEIARERGRLAQLPATDAATAAAEMLATKVRRRKARPLLLLDQFEVVALRATDEQHPTARAVTMFLRAVLDPQRRSGVAMLCAATDQVEARLADPHVFGPLVTRGIVARLGPPTRDELAEVVRKPFEAWGAPLDGPAGARLQSSLDAFLRDTNATGDLLPLISLQLTKLYDAIKDDIEKLIRRAERLPESSSGMTMIRERDVAERIDFGAVINDAVSAAVRSVRERLHVTAGDDELDGLFDRLVELGPPSSDARGSHDRPLLLKSDRLPDRLTTTCELAAELSRRRLLVSLGGSRYRLVHEVVARQWEAFNDWLARRDATLDTIRKLRPLHEVYEQEAPADRPAMLAPFRQKALGAARVLLDLVEVLGTANDADLDDAMRARRDFYLALIAAHPDCAGELVDSIDRQKKVTRIPVAHIVARYHRPDVMQTLLASDPDLVHRLRLPEGRSILVAATHAEDQATVSLLLAHGADPSVTETEGQGWNAVLAAAFAGDVTIFDRYVAMGADPLAALRSGWTTVQLAAYWNHPQLVEHIAARVPADRFQASLAGGGELTAVQWAAQRGHIQVLEALSRVVPSALDAPAGAIGVRPLYLAVSNGQVPATAWLAARPDVDVDALANDPASGDAATPPVMAAVRAGADAGDLLAALFESGRADPNVRARPSQRTALHHAARAGAVSTVRRLLAHPRIEPNAQSADGVTPLAEAVDAERWGVVELLMSDRARVDPFIADHGGRTVLSLAHAHRARTLVESLLRRLPDDTDHVESNGWTPLLFAAWYGLEKERDRFLTGRGDRPLADDGEPDTPWTAGGLVTIAVDHGDLAFLQRVLADPRVRPTASWPEALRMAAMRPNRLDALKILLADRRFNPDVPLFQGEESLRKRPIHYAAIAGNVEGVRLLAEVTSDPLDAWGREPAELAPTAVRQLVQDVTRRPAAAAAASPPSPTVSPEHRPATAASPEDEQLSEPERAALLKRMSRADEVLDFTQEGTVFRTRRYSLYPGSVLVEISNAKWPLGLYVRVYLMVVGDLTSDAVTIVRLDGTARPINELNRRTGLVVGPDNVIEYLKFYCFFMWGDGGPFYVVPEEGAPSHIAEDTKVDPGESGVYGTLRELYRPPMFHGQAADQSMRASALVYYIDNIFYAEFVIQPYGFIKMVEDERLIAGLGVNVDVPAPAIGGRTGRSRPAGAPRPSRDRAARE